MSCFHPGTVVVLAEVIIGEFDLSGSIPSCRFRMYLLPDQQFNPVIMRTVTSLMLVKQVNSYVFLSGKGGSLAAS